MINARYPQDLFVNHDGLQGQKEAKCNTRVFGQRNLGGGGGGGVNPLNFLKKNQRVFFVEGGGGGGGC